MVKRDELRGATIGKRQEGIHKTCAATGLQVELFAHFF
jgi:hypothetical protein